MIQLRVSIIAEFADFHRFRSEHLSLFSPFVRKAETRVVLAC